MQVIWLIEHIARELDVAAACAALLERDFGVQVIVLPYVHPDADPMIGTYHPDCVLLPYCYSFSDPHLAPIFQRWPEAVYVNLSWEQIFYQANLEYKAPQDDFAKQSVYHHVWSRERKKFLLSRGVPDDHIFLNGHPAYKLYDLPYRKIFTNRTQLAEEFSLDPKKRWVFFPENYSWFFYSDHNLAEIIKKGQNEHAAHLMRDYCRRCFTDSMKWLSQAAKQNKHVEIILRPRPAFSSAYFMKKVRDVLTDIPDRLHIIKNYSVREWILASDGVISSFSTSLIEASVAGKSVSMIESHPIPPPLQSFWYRYVSRIRTKEELFKTLDQKPNQASGIRLQKWARKELFVNEDPISGLVEYIGKKSFRRPKGEKRIIPVAATSPSAMNAFAKKIHAGLGTVKRKLFGNALYQQNDDQDVYMPEIAKAMDRYRNFFTNKPRQLQDQ